MLEMLKTYQSYTSLKRYGIRCMLNCPTGSYLLHRHDYFEFEIIKSGSVSHELNGVREVLRAGDVIALSPKDIHRFTVLEPVEILNLCVYYKDTPSAVQNLLSSVKFPLRGKISDTALDRIIDYFEKIDDKIKTGGAFERDVITAYTILFLTDLYSVAKYKTATRTTGGYTYIASAMEFIAANYTSHISLEEVASSVHLTPSYFSKLFAEITDKSFVRYLTEQRVEHARLLLATTDNSVTEVAFASGFGSFSAFSRAFRTCCGVTPNEFRKYARIA